MGQDGRMHEVSTGQTSKAKARQVIKAAKIEELELAAKIGAVQREAVEKIVVGKKILIKDAIEQCLKWMNSIGKSPSTIANVERALLQWAEKTGSERMALRDLDEAAIDEWVNRDSPIKAGYRNVILAAFKNLCVFSAAKGWISRDPSTLVRVKYHLLTHEQKETTEKKLFTRHQIETLLAKTDPGTFWHSAIAIGAYTGLRLGDVCNLQWSCFSEDRTRMIVWTDKGNTRVDLPVDAPAVLKKAIAAMPVLHDTWCFPDQREICIDPNRRGGLSMQFMRLLEKLGIEGRSFHSFRHTYATEHHKSGEQLFKIRADLGHRSEVTTRRYIHDRD